MQALSHIFVGDRFGARTPSLALTNRSATVRRHEQRPHDLLATHRFPPVVRVPPLCRAVRRQPPNPQLLVLGSVPVHGLWPTDRSGIAARYGHVSAGPERATLSRGSSWPRLAQHAGGRQRIARLAHLWRLRR